MSFQCTQDQRPIINHSECHIPCVLVVDTSTSMTGDPINELNKGLTEFGDALQSNFLAQGCAEVCIISFNSSVNIEMGFRPAIEYEAPTLEASGLTSMNEAINTALDTLEARRAEYREIGVRYYRPWLFLLTDGAPTDACLESSVKRRLQKAIQDKKVTYLPMGVGTNADIAKLQSYYPDDAVARPVLRASTFNFREVFFWLGGNFPEVPHSDPNVYTEFQLPATPSCITVDI